MNFNENKIEVGILLLIVVMISGLFRMFGLVGGTDKVIEPQEISYEMPRPKDDLPGEFGLDGREIDRRYVNPFALNKTADKKTLKPAQPAPAKKAAAVAEAPKNPQLYLRKKPTTEFNVVGRDEKPASDEGGPAPANHNPSGSPQRNVAKDPANDPKDDVMSPAQWRALLLAQPTKENMNKLLEAMQKGDVDRSTFYSISEDLLKSSKKEESTLALYGLNRVGDTGSFAVVAKHYDSLPADVKPAAQQFMMSYTAPSRHGALKGALQVSDANVAMKAAQVVLAGVQSAKTGQNPVANPRQVRGEARQTTVTSYASFASIFQKWATSGNSNLQGIASQILGLLPA